VCFQQQQQQNLQLYFCFCPYSVTIISFGKSEPYMLQKYIFLLLTYLKRCCRRMEKKEESCVYVKGKEQQYP
jgi:hypothetical protein